MIKRIWPCYIDGRIAHRLLMLHIRRTGLRRSIHSHLAGLYTQTCIPKRTLLTLAIESSCDDTCVALLEKHTTPGKPVLEIHHHERVTADNTAHRGIHPLVALDSHQTNLASLVQRALKHPCLSGMSNDAIDRTGGVSGTGTGRSPTPDLRHGHPADRRKPDFISVTRGPGMRANLNAGLDLAKGLAVAWNVPLVGVHHMQAHALTPRLVSASNRFIPADNAAAGDDDPPLPFLSLLVSGGHTLLIHSRSLTDHAILAETTDIAAGDCLDKIARTVLPPELIASSKTTSYGPLLEKFTHPESSPGGGSYDYVAPVNNSKALTKYVSTRGWSLQPPLATAKGGSKAQSMEFALSGICSGAQHIITRFPDLDEEGRRELAAVATRFVFEHLSSRMMRALDDAAAISAQNGTPKLQHVVVSGGVAANKFLRFVLRQNLDARGHKDVKLLFPPIELCTDNAIMIGWTGIEMFEAGWESSLDCQSIRKWPLSGEGGGVLGVGGWIERSKVNYITSMPSLAIKT